MSSLTFKDIDDWTPSSISIVDVPSHPLCIFEVYSEDEEFVKKSIDIKGENMVDSKEEPKVEVSEGFLERLLNRSVFKSADEEIPKEQPAKPTSEKPADDKLLARIEKLEARVAQLEKDNKPEEKPSEEKPADEVVTKSEGETAEAETVTTEEPEVVEKSVTDEAVTKSLDPDMITTSTVESDKSLVERAGRNSNGMSW